MLLSSYTLNAHTHTRLLLKCFNTDSIIHKYLAAMYNTQSTMLVAIKGKNVVTNINSLGEVKHIV